MKVHRFKMSCSSLWKLPRCSKEEAKACILVTREKGAVAALDSGLTDALTARTVLASF